jgi:hypothetical protein
LDDGGETPYWLCVFCFCFLPGETPNLYDNYKASDRIAPKLTLVGGETYHNVVLEWFVHWCGDALLDYRK